MGEAQRQITAEETAQWLAERFQNCLRIGSGKTGADQAGWIEDAAYFARALEIVTRAQEEKQGMGECPNCEGLGYIGIPRCCGRPEIGRASWRERVWQEVSVGGGG